MQEFSSACCKQRITAVIPSTDWPALKLREMILFTGSSQHYLGFIAARAYWQILQESSVTMLWLLCRWRKVEIDLPKKVITSNGKEIREAFWKRLRQDQNNSTHL